MENTVTPEEERVSLWDCRRGQRIRVWAFPDEIGLHGQGYKEGVVEQIDDVGGYLSTRVAFQDGRVFYARSYAQTRLVT